MLYWPPVDGVLYSLAGPVSTMVPIVVKFRGSLNGSADVYLRNLVGYKVTTERVMYVRNFTPSVPVPPDLMYDE